MQRALIFEGIYCLGCSLIVYWLEIQNGQIKSLDRKTELCGLTIKVAFFGSSADEELRFETLAL